MNKTYKIIIILLVFIVGISGYLYVRNMPQDETAPFREDRLAKTEEEGIEENINAYDIEEDLRITRMIERDGERHLALSQQERNQLLEKIGSKSFNTVLEEYNTTLPANINNALQYYNYNISYDYFLVTAEGGGYVRENPVPGGTVVARVEHLDKVSLLQRVEGENVAGSDIWYRVVSGVDNQVYEGYLHSTIGTPRKFRFERMEQAVNELRDLLARGDLNFINNYKNNNGTPPQIGDYGVDEHGYRVYHSAPGYEQANTETNFRYIPDGMLVRILDELEDFYHVNVPDFGRNFYVPKQYIDPDVRLNQLNHVVVVDRNQQNQAAFEVVEGGLNLVSYTLSTTGIAGNFSFETSLGKYKAIEKRERFEYLKAGSQEIAGYAPFAIRFSGGAYIHGVPVTYQEQNGKKIDPGLEEYLQTIGSFPRSSMCVRNYTSHAQFLYNWMDTVNGAVIVIE